MHEHCHRCHALLPLAAPGSSRGDEDALLFCPRCGAPQILLPEHLRPDAPASVATSSTGAEPPPRPASASPLDWQAAIKAGAWVAAVGVLLALLGLRYTAASLLCTLWVISGAVIALGLYARSRPQSRLDAKLGLRIGAATGLLMGAAIGIGIAVAGLVMRFGTHSMQGFDASMSQAFGLFRAQMVDRMAEQNQPANLQQSMLGFMDSQEFKAGAVLAYAGFLGCLIVLFSACGGAFAGMLRAAQSPRAGLRRGE
jgi:hypothetical protein